MAAITVARLVVLFITPLQLYPDEAQYWLWSRELAFGYYSKPPIVAWLIALTTAIGGDGEPWIRLSATLLHAGAALALFAAGRLLYDGWTGFWAAALYSLMPGVQLSAGVIATDAPLLFFLSLAVLAYAAALRRPSLGVFVGLGAALGLATLSKYAALYFLAGLVLHAMLSREARQTWTGARLTATAAGLLVVLAPNLAWNAAHGFSTVTHTAANANWEAGERFQLSELLSFIGEQFAVFGPLPFTVFVAGSLLLTARRRLQPADLALLCLTLPPLLVVSAQAFISRANANWAAAAYPSAAVLVAAWLVRRRARRTLAAAVVIQSAGAALFLVLAAAPSLADALGVANAFKRARGWKETTEAVLARADLEPGLTAIAVDDRFYFNAMAYYGRDWWSRTDSPPLRMWVRELTPQNQAETTAPLTTSLGARVLAVSGVPAFRPELRADFGADGPPQVVAIPLDRKRTRDFELFIGERFAPRPRDPATGLPVSGPRPS